MFDEATIIINGSVISKSQATTIRCALESFYSSLKNDGLGEDEHNKAMVSAYCKKMHLTVHGSA